MTDDGTQSNNAEAEERRLTKALDIAIEKTKQLIALAAGIIGVTITFSKDLLGGLVAWTVIPLMVGWFLYLMSIILGVEVLGIIAGRLNLAELEWKTLKSPAIVNCAKWQERCFLGGVFFTVAFAISAFVAILIKVGFLGPIPGPAKTS